MPRTAPVVPTRGRHRRRRRLDLTRLFASRPLRALLAMVVTALSLVFLSPQSASAAPAIQVVVSGPSTVLVGGHGTYRITATNPSANPTAQVEYNLSYRDVLPTGVTYVPGSTTPAAFGDPVVRTDALTGQQTLVWANVTDLAVDADVTLSFTAAFDATARPVGSQVVDSGAIYAHTDPRFVPKFDADGVPVPSSYTQSATAAGGQTLVTALEVKKSEPSSEQELVRGVHDHPTVYTLEVTNNGTAATDDVTVSDYLPAGLEFLGCGQVDNGGGFLEYPGAGSLTATPAVGATCRAPASVATVVDPAGYPTGTYTRVVWNLDTMGPGDDTTLEYAAGVPQRSNTVTWPGATPPPAGLQQTANLTNNTGAPTRETATELALVNHVHAEGDYTGPLAGSALAHVTADASQQVTAEDVALEKSVSPSGFVQDGVATYTLRIRTGEYADAGNVVVVDHLPNGLCPLDDVANRVTGTPADCDPDGAFAPTGASFSDVQQNSDGTFDITFSPVAVAHDDVVTITFQAEMRATYTGGPKAGQPTSAGDTYVNHASLSATTDPAPGVVPPDPTGPLTVNDDSAATISSGGPVVTKSVMPDTTPMDCSAGPYLTDPTPAQITFSEGSRACFQIRVDFPSTISTRNPVVTDFLPVGVTYEAGSATLTGNNTVTAALDTTGGDPVWTLGDPNGSGHFVQKGGVFEVRLSGIVSDPGKGPLPDLTANLAKLRYSDGTGGTVSARDLVDVRRSAPPPVAIAKGVLDVNDLPGGGNPTPVDGSTVRGDDVVTFAVDVTNNGSAADDNAVDVSALDVWDVLPAGVRCADTSAISDSGACSDPGSGQLPFSGSSTRSAVRWQLASTTVAPGASTRVSYDMTIPTGVGVSTTFSNTAAVRSYETATNIPGVTSEHLPEDNVDTSTDPDVWDVPAAADASNVVTPDPVVAKTATTDIVSAPDNNTASQAVVGEGITYTLSVHVPSHTSVFQGRLTDSLPAGISFVSASAGYSATNTSPATDPLPAGVTLSGSDGTLDLGATYANSTGTSQLFEVTVLARVATTPSTNHGTVRTNTARFNSQTAATGGTALPEISRTAGVTVVVPSPTLTKTDDDADQIVVAEQTVTYTLQAQNASGRPTMHDSWVVDCVPAGLTFDAFVDPHPGTATVEPGTGANGCAADRTRVAWDLGDVTATAKTLSYTVTVSSDSAGETAYANTATLTGSTLDDGKGDPQQADNPLERTLSATANDTVTVQSAGITKTTDAPTSRTVGEVGSWTVTATIPSQVNFYDAAVVDRLPIGIDPTSLQTTAVTCTYQGGGSCVLPGGGTALTPVAGPGTDNRVGWLLGDLTFDATVRVVTISYTGAIADVPSVQRGTLVTNNVSLGWDSADGADPGAADVVPDRTTGEVPASVRIKEPKLSVAKKASDTSPEPGTTFTYTVTVSNSSLSDVSAAYGITISDDVPTGVIVDALTISDGGVLTGAGPQGGGTISWNVAGPLAADSGKALTYDATLADSLTLDASARTNTADITGYQSLPTGGRAYDGPSISAPITPDFPHVSAAKAVGDSRAYIDEPTTWTVTVTSNGGATARDVDAVDTLPLNWQYDAGSALVVVAGGAPTAIDPQLGTSGGRQTLTWTDLADLPVGKTVVISYRATPSSDVLDDPGVGSSVPHSNLAAVAAADLTGAEGNLSGPYHGNPASATARIDSADLEVVTSHTGSPVAGTTFGFSDVVTNHGGDTARGPFTVTDDLPSQISTATADGPGWTCSVGTGDVTCQRTDPTDTLAPDASFPAVTVHVDVPADTPAATTLTNDADVDAHTYDPEPGNNSDEDIAAVTTSADLVLAKQLTSGGVTPGADATYTLTVSNDGPSDAVGPLTVTDTLPAGTTVVSATGPGWSCSGTTGTLECTHAAGLPFGSPAAQIAVEIAVPADQQADVMNTASVDGPDDDPIPGNNEDSVTTSPVGSADLGIEKTSTSAFVPGSTGSYRFSVHNDGPSYADSPVRVTDVLPDELTYAGSTSVQGTWTCSATGQTLTCDLQGRLADDADAVVDVDVDIDADHTGNTHNDVTVSSGTADGNAANDTDADDTGNNVKSDLSITKTHTGDAVAGGTVDYALVVRNLGPSTSSGPITVTDTLPVGMAFSSASGTGWTCGHVGRVITCTRAGVVKVGVPPATIAVTASIDSGAGPATLTNVATVDGPENDTVLTNNTDDDPTTVGDEANISVTKTTTGADPVRAGETTSFDITVHNDGPADADDVAVDDALPAGLSLVSAGGTGWSCDAGLPVHCERPTVGAGLDATVTVVARAGAGVPDGTTITNTASATTSTPGDDAADNTDGATVDVVAEADLALTKTHPVGPVIAGTDVTFDLTVTDEGPSDAQAPIVVVDRLPVGLSYVASGGPWTCDAGTVGPSGQQVSCTLDGSDPLLATVDAPSLTLTALVSPAADDGTLTNQASVSGGTDDPTPGNDDATDDVSVITQADLSIVQTHVGSARVGDPLHLTMQVRDDGPSEARAVTVQDTLPPGLAYRSANGTGWTCSATGADMTCSMAGRLAAGADAEPIDVVVNVDPAAYPLVANTAEVSSATFELDPADNTSSDQVGVPALTDLRLTKHHVGPVKVGQDATYRLRVSNHGRTPEPGPIEVVDNLPVGLTYVGSAGTGWTCSADGRQVTCAGPGLDVHESTTVTLTVRTGPAAYPAVVNTASVTSPSQDMKLANNTAEDHASVRPAVDLSVVKKVESSSPGHATYRISVTNRGPNDTVSDVIVVDRLPVGLDLVRAHGTGWGCGAVSDTVMCAYAPVLRVGHTVSFLVETTVTAQPGTTVVNRAVVVGGDTDGERPDDSVELVSPAEGGLPPGGDPSGQHGPGGWLPGTGGVPLGWLLTGLLLVTSGTVLWWRARRVPVGADEGSD